MARTMYDSITAADIPRNAQMVAGYVSGRYRWTAADWNLFPNAVKVRIATQASVNDGHVLDVEPGDATPDQAPGWVLRRRAAGIDPSIYCNQLNGWDAVRQAFQNQHIPEPHYWVARYDGKATIPAGAVAKQYANPTVHGQGHYDLSVVADYWPGIDSEEEHKLTCAFNPDGDRKLMQSANARATAMLTMSADSDAVEEGDPAGTVHNQLAAFLHEMKDQLTAAQATLAEIKTMIGTGFTVVPHGSITFTTEPTA